MCKVYVLKKVASTKRKEADERYTFLCIRYVTCQKHTTAKGYSYSSLSYSSSFLLIGVTHV